MSVLTPWECGLACGGPLADSDGRFKAHVGRGGAPAPWWDWAAAGRQARRRDDHRRGPPDQARRRWRSAAMAIMPANSKLLPTGSGTAIMVSDTSLPNPVPPNLSA